MAQVAGDNGTAFAGMSRHTTLHCLPARLDRDLLSVHPELADALLHRKVAPAPPELLDAVTVAYDDVKTHPVHPITRTEVPRAAPTQTEEAFHAIQRA